MASHGGQRLLIENLADQTEILEHQHLGSVGNGDACRLLATVLQRIKAVVGELGHILARGPDAEDAAFLFRLVLFRLNRLEGHDGCSLGAVGDAAQSTVIGPE